MLANPPTPLSLFSGDTKSVTCLALLGMGELMHAIGEATRVPRSQTLQEGEVAVWCAECWGLPVLLCYATLGPALLYTVVVELWLLECFSRRSCSAAIGYRPGFHALFCLTLREVPYATAACSLEWLPRRLTVCLSKPTRETVRTSFTSQVTATVYKNHPESPPLCDSEGLCSA